MASRATAAKVFLGGCAVLAVLCGLGMLLPPAPGSERSGEQVQPAPAAPAPAPAPARPPAPMCGSWVRSTVQQKAAATLVNLSKLQKLEDTPWSVDCLAARLDRIVADLDLMCEEDGRGADDELFVVTLRTSARDVCGAR